MKLDDSLWKAILEDVFEDFLLFFFPNASELFDLNRGFEYLDKELEQLFPPDADMYAPRYVDKLVKVFTRQNDQSTEQWLLVHIEVQGYRDAHFAERMFQYYYRIFDKYRQRITAFALFTGDHKQFRPNRYEQSCLGTQLSYTYNVYTILEQNEDDLIRNPNPFAMVVLTAKTALLSKTYSELDLLDRKIELAKRLLSSQIPKPKIKSLINFLRYYIRLERQETVDRFDKEIDQITQTNTTMGIEEFLLDRAEKQGIKKGLEQGIEQGKRLVIQRLLAKTTFTAEQIADIVGVTISQVENVQKESL